MKLKTLLFVLMLGFTFVNCSSSDDENTPPITPEESSATATITLDDGQVLNFISTYNNNIALADKMFGLGLLNTNSGMYIYMMIMSNEDLAPRTHDGYIKISQLDRSDIIDESYDSHYNTNPETEEEGSSILTITAMGNNRIQGTFSGTLYSASGKTLLVENGVFEVIIDESL